MDGFGGVVVDPDGFILSDGFLVEGVGLRETEALHVGDGDLGEAIGNGGEDVDGQEVGADIESDDDHGDAQDEEDLLELLHEEEVADLVEGVVDVLLVLLDLFVLFPLLLLKVLIGGVPLPLLHFLRLRLAFDFFGLHPGEAGAELLDALLVDLAGEDAAAVLPGRPRLELTLHFLRDLLEPVLLRVQLLDFFIARLLLIVEVVGELVDPFEDGALALRRHHDPLQHHVLRLVLQREDERDQHRRRQDRHYDAAQRYYQHDRLPAFPLAHGVGDQLLHDEVCQVTKVAVAVLGDEEGVLLQLRHLREELQHRLVHELLLQVVLLQRGEVRELRQELIQTDLE
mmetsp:Transcript_42697/g.41006  ORF Transcript_42697/g.41006 Transcript_42697/m.41006 type:complete len:342 (+) Transcript_42697:662-1687(+)